MDEVFYLIVALPEYLGQRQSYFDGEGMSEDIRRAHWFMTPEVAETVAANCGMTVDVLSYNISQQEHIKRITPLALAGQNI